MAAPFTSDPGVDQAYSPSRSLPEGVFQAHLDLYRDRSLEVYRTCAHERDIRLRRGQRPAPRHRARAGPGLKPAFVFIHGGYWRMLSKDESVYPAPALNARGITLVAPDYSLAPATSLEEIVRQVRTAIAWLHRHGAEHGIDPERLFVGGHSAGGHLTGAIVADGWRAAYGLPEDVVKGAMPVSGIFDLEPITAPSSTNGWASMRPGRGAEPGAPSPAAALPDGRGLGRRRDARLSRAVAALARRLARAEVPGDRAGGARPASLRHRPRLVRSGSAMTKALAAMVFDQRVAR
jgi:hypothetical protein